MTTKKEPAKDATEQFKAMLAAKTGGKPEDWKRVSKKKYYGDILRKFKNKKGEEVYVTERPDGLIYAELPGDKDITARLPFNAAAKPSALDIVMNKILEQKDCDDAIYAQAVKEGLVKKFSFYVTKYDDGIAEEGESPMYTVIYPTVRDETFKCAAYIRPMVPKGDDTDECVVTEWRFPKSMDTPAKVVKHLEGLGMTWDVEYQKERHNDAYKEITAERGASKPAAKAKAPKR